MSSPKQAIKALGLVCLLAALTIGLYLAWTSFTAQMVAGCSENAGCREVLQSRWSVVLGVPISLFGVLAYAFLVFTGLTTFKTGSIPLPLRYLETTAFALVLVGALWFTAVQALILHAFCPWCCTAHALASGGVLLCWAVRDRETERTAGSGRLATFLPWGLALAAVAALAVIQSLSSERERVATFALAEPAFRSGSEGRLELYDGDVSLDSASLPFLGTVGMVSAVALTDFTCPYCRELHQTLEEALTEAPDPTGFLLVPAYRDARAREVHRVMLTLWRSNPEHFRTLSQSIVAGEVQPTPAATLAEAQKILNGEFYREAWKNAPWVEEAMRMGEELLERNDANLERSTLPQLMIGSEILVGKPRLETILERLRSSAGQPIRIAAAPPKSKPLSSTPILGGNGKLTFTTTRLDLGEITKGEKVVGRFEFKNTGTGPLAITRIKPACGCTTVEGGEQTVQAGETGSFQVELDTAKITGKILKPISVESSASRTPVRVYIAGEVWTPVRVTPTTVSFGSLVDGAEITPKRLEITVTDKDLLPIAGVRSTNPYYQTELKTIEEGRRYSVIVSIPERGSGMQRGELVIPLNHPRLAELKVPLFANAVSAVRISPQTIIRRPGPRAEPAKVFIAVYSQDPKFPRLELSDLKYVGKQKVLVELHKNLSLRSRRIQVTFPAGFDPAIAQSADSHIRFNTNHPDHAEVRIPIQVYQSASR